MEYTVILRAFCIGTNRLRACYITLLFCSSHHS